MRQAALAAGALLVAGFGLAAAVGPDTPAPAVAPAAPTVAVTPAPTPPTPAATRTAAARPSVTTSGSGVRAQQQGRTCDSPGARGRTSSGTPLECAQVEPGRPLRWLPAD